MLLLLPFVNPSSTIVTKGSNLSHSKHVSEHHLFCGLPHFGDTLVNVFISLWLGPHLAVRVCLFWHHQYWSVCVPNAIGIHKFRIWNTIFYLPSSFLCHHKQIGLQNELFCIDALIICNVFSILTNRKSKCIHGFIGFWTAIGHNIVSWICKWRKCSKSLASLEQRTLPLR